MDVYKDAPWQYEAADEQVMVLHTLVIDPLRKGQGLGKIFVRFYEDYARKNGCPYLRMDTNALNVPARAFYKKQGYKEIAILPCTFNNIAGVQLVLLEKKLQGTKERKVCEKVPMTVSCSTPFPVASDAKK